MWLAAGDLGPGALLRWETRQKEVTDIMCKPNPLAIPKEKDRNMNGGISFSSAVLLTLLASSLSFFGGRVFSIHYLKDVNTWVQNPAVSPVKILNKLKTKSYADTVSRKMPMSPHKMPMNARHETLTPPKPINGKRPPKTKYTSVVSKLVHVMSERYADIHLHDHIEDLRDEEEVHSGICNFNSEGDHECLIDKFTQEDYDATFALQKDDTEDDEDDDDDEEEEEHLPAGQHLIIDMENVNHEFLDSADRLAEAMVKVVNESQLTLLSYHCHKLIPMGVSCVGVLLESHISFHTWPDKGVIALDLFTCGSGLLIPVLPIIEKLFAIPMTGVTEKSSAFLKPRMVWSHKLRGFGNYNDDPLHADLGELVLESHSYEYKKEIASVKSPFQTIDVFDTLDDRDDYHRFINSIENLDSYEARNREEMFRPNRQIFLGGVLQSESESEATYHEALVQPTMFTHPNPRRVAIIGGGEGATLREVLKHDTVEKVKMIEIDEIMVQTSRKYIPMFSNCTFIEGSAEWCGDDDRTEMHYTDALKWFMDRFGEDVTVDEDPFDVIIMDALDPEDDIPFAAMLYDDDKFATTLFNALTEQGIIVFQLGEAPSFTSPASQYTKSRRRDGFIKHLANAQFDIMHVYDDGNCGFNGPWSFLMAMKDDNLDEDFYHNQLEVDVKIKNRLRRSTDGKPMMDYFDGALMQGYQYPHKVWETVYCRSKPTPESCHKFESKKNVPISDLEVKLSGFGEDSGRGVYTKVDIKEGMTVGGDGLNLVHMRGLSFVYLLKYFNISDDHENVLNYINGYGYEEVINGGYDWLVEPSIMTFVNHGCNGTFNFIGREDYEGWKSNDPHATVTEQNYTSHEFYPYRAQFHDIYQDRHPIKPNIDVAMRDIKAGEEILNNYVFFEADVQSWEASIAELQKVCNGEKVGEITEAERSEVKKTTSD